MFAIFKAAVPVASLLKSNTKVSHAFVTVVNASVSQLIVLFVSCSTFNRTGIPGPVDHTLTLIDVAPNANGIGFKNPTSKFAPPFGSANVVPAHVGDPAVFIVCTTVFEGSVGSTTIVDTVVPKSIKE